MFQSIDIATLMLASFLAFPWLPPGITARLSIMFTRPLLRFLRHRSIWNKTAAHRVQDSHRNIGGTTVQASKVIILTFKNVLGGGNVFRPSLRT